MLRNLGISITVVTLATNASAQDAPPPKQEPSFGDRGTIVVSDDAAFGIGVTWYGRIDRGAGFSFALSPALDWFVARGFSIGGTVSGTIVLNRRLVCRSLCSVSEKNDNLRRNHVYGGATTGRHSSARAARRLTRRLVVAATTRRRRRAD